MKFKSGITEKNIIVKCGADKFLPFSLVLGFYVILFGTISPGGGFQGGVCVASAVLMLYLGYGFDVVNKVIRSEVLRINEAIAASLYVLLGVAGLVVGANFATNIYFDIGHVGEMISAGTISFMGYAVGYKVLCGVGFLIMLMLSMLSTVSEEEESGTDGEEAQEAADTAADDTQQAAEPADEGAQQAAEPVDEGAQQAAGPAEVDVQQDAGTPAAEMKKEQAAEPAAVETVPAETAAADAGKEA